jgi:ABC-type sugar transport system substrate-binding protein
VLGLQLRQRRRKQTQQISNLISQHVDAIVITPLADRSTASSARRAPGILVISFDNIVTTARPDGQHDQLKFGSWRPFLADSCTAGNA